MTETPDLTEATANQTGPASASAAGATSVVAARRVRSLPPIVRGLVFFGIVAAVVGALAGLVWHSVVRLPEYVMGSDGRATTTERGLTRFFTVDAWYCLLGLLCGLLIGVLAWYLFRRLGWWVTLISLLASFLAALVCWQLGTAMGPHNFSARISAATAGQHLPIDFRLRSLSAILVWVLAADLPVLLFSALTRDADDADGQRRPWRFARLGRRPPTQAPGAPAETSEHVTEG